LQYFFEIGGALVKREEILKLLAARRANLTDLGVKSLALFGSVARGEDRPNSDLDILVEFEHPATFDLYMDLKFFLEDLLESRVDLVTRKALKPQLQPRVEEEALYVT
jgi:predicted nucleotidyltransferase